MSILNLKLNLLDTDIRREVQISDDWTLAKLHKLIQVVMGWEDAHSHEFRKGHEKQPERSAVAEVLPKPASKLLYLYDFGDSWEIEVKRVADKPLEQGVLPPRCLDGQLAGPPEDCGGVPGYHSLVAAKKKPKPSQEESAILEWAGDWEPLHFDLGQVNRELARRFKTKPAKAAPGKFTEKQGQYLSFIFWATRVNRQPPSQAEMQSFFGVTGAAVAGMVATLESLGLVEREPGKARTVRVLWNESELPRLEEPTTPMIPVGPMWVRW